MGYKFNANRTAMELILWIRDWFEKNGKGCNAVIGISGGKDSSVVAALCVHALGPDRVYGVLMPNGEQNDIDDSYELVQHLGIKYATTNISQIIESFKNGFCFVNNDYIMESPVLWSEQTKINLPPRIRMTMLYAISQSVNGRVSNNCNLSEDWIGYSTRYGDSVGDFSPLSQLTTDEVVAVGRELGLPEKLINKVPADGLCGKTDEDNFGFSYQALNKYIREGICEDEEIKRKIDYLHDKNRFKLLPMEYYVPSKKCLWENA